MWFPACYLLTVVNSIDAALRGTCTRAIDDKKLTLAIPCTLIPWHGMAARFECFKALVIYTDFLMK